MIDLPSNPRYAQDMKQPRIHPLLTDIVQTGLLACDGIIFDQRNGCPVCGANVSGYDTKKKQFVIMHDRDSQIPVHIFVKRFYCRQCGSVCFADEPFYPDTRIGSPVVDLCITLAETMPFGRAAVFLEKLGVGIDRGTVRNYTHRAFPHIPTTDLFGIRLPLSIVSLSELATQIGEGRRIPGTEVLAACGFPSAYRAAPDPSFPSNKGNKGDKQKRDKERQSEDPEDQ